MMDNLKWIGVGTLAGIAIIVGEYFYVRSHAIEERDIFWQDKIKNAPVTSTMQELKSDTTQRQPQHMAAVAETSNAPVELNNIGPFWPPGDHRGDSTEYHYAALFDEVRDLRQTNARLRDSVSAILSDTLGGRHEVHYNPVRRLFTEDYFPGPEITRHTLQTDTRQVLEIKSYVFTAGLSFEYQKTIGTGAGASLGIKPIYIGVTKFFDERDLLYRLGANFEFGASNQ